MGYFAAQHAGGACLWLHLLLPVGGDSQRVPNEAEALGREGGLVARHERSEFVIAHVCAIRVAGLHIGRVCPLEFIAALDEAKSLISQSHVVLLG